MGLQVWCCAEGLGEAFLWYVSFVGLISILGLCTDCLIEEERIPYHEGYRKPEVPLLFEDVVNMTQKVAAVKV
jgi:hypothetical protein